jgi:hypothetical protein
MWVRGGCLKAALNFAYHVDVGFAVLGSWAALVLNGRWRPKPSWIDRSGRAIGATWIGAVVLSRFLFGFP